MTDKLPFERSPHIPHELWEVENRLIHQRRRGGGELPQRQSAEANDHVVGVALSGGGIRSATLSLGILQALAKHKCLRRVDYLSTVSGGGYAGAFLGGLYSRWRQPREPAKATFERVEDALGDPKGHPIDWLRENGRYLAPNGAGSLALAAAIAIRNLFAIHLVIGTFFLMLSLMVNGLRRLSTRGADPGAHPWPPFFRRFFEECNLMLTSHDVWISPIIFAAALVLVLYAIPAGIAYWLVRSDEQRNGVSEREWVRIAGGVLVLLASAGGCFYAYQSIVPRLSGPNQPSVLPVVVTAALTTSMAIAMFMSHAGSESSGMMMRAQLTTRLRDGLIATAAVLALAFIDTIGQTLYVRLLDGNAQLMAAGIGSAFAVAATVATFAQRLAGHVSDKTQGGIKLSANFIATVAGFGLLLMILVGFSAISHSLSWDDKWLANRAQVCLPSDADRGCAGGDGTQLVVLPPEHPSNMCHDGTGLRKCTPGELDSLKYWLSLLATTILTGLFGRIPSFVNRSSLATFYGTRLARAYLGASNEKRLDAKHKMLDELLKEDDLALAEYRPHMHGGPLPLINVTLNETTGGRSQIDQRDRKGMNMAIGPAGISVGVKHHAAWKDNADDGAPRPGGLTPTQEPVMRKNDRGEDTVFRVFPEPGHTITPLWPTLGRWIAISGAAVSTGLGARTSAGLALVLGLLNFRLGQWWNSEIDASSRPTVGSQRTPFLSRALRTLLPVHAMLLHELFARFPGTSSREWYLSDGGHFENSGAYELIRRRVPYIIICDNGADPQRCFDDLGNLVRKARNDFGAQIELVSSETLRTLKIDHVVGTLGQLGFCGRLSEAHTVGAAQAANMPVPSNTNASTQDVNRYATLARIRYDGAPDQNSALLILRPAVLGREPLDVLNYQIAHPEFPQQSTGDQFFDEDQWEAYRRLGENMANEVFSVLRPKTDSVEQGWELIDLSLLRDDARSAVGPAPAFPNAFTG